MNEFYADESFYANDLLKSVTTTEEAVNFAKEITEVMRRGGFRLTRVISNDMNSIPVTEKELHQSMTTPMSETLELNGMLRRIFSPLTQ